AFSFYLAIFCKVTKWLSACWTESRRGRAAEQRLAGFHAFVNISRGNYNFGGPRTHQPKPGAVAASPAPASLAKQPTEPLASPSQASAPAARTISSSNSTPTAEQAAGVQSPT